MEITLTQEEMERCAEFGKRVVASYQNGSKENSRGLAIEGKPRIDGNAHVQTIGRMAELAFAKAFGIDPDSLDWGERCDYGYDLKLSDGRTVDIKASDHPYASRLIWPVSKNHFLHKGADLLVFAKVKENTVELCGFAPKIFFIQNAVVARGERGIVDGTRYMSANKLFAIKEIMS